MQKATVQIPFGGGLDSKSDSRLVRPPNASVLKNALFDEAGGYQTRNPYTQITTQTDGRKLVPFGDELLLFTKDALYSWSDAEDSFISRGVYLAPKVTERSVFTKNTEQTLCERWDTGSVILYAWLDNGDGATAVFVAARDKNTGATIVRPTSLGANTTKPRFSQGSSSRYVQLFAQTATNTLSVKVIDTSTAALIASTAAAAWTSVATNYDVSYDVTALSATSSVAVWRRTVTTAYGYASITNSGTTPTVTANTKGRTCDGPIAVAVTADYSTGICVARTDGTTLTSDILSIAFADVHTSQAIEASGFTAGAERFVTAAFRSTQDSGAYRCYIFSATVNGDYEAATNQYDTTVNWIDTGGARGSGAGQLSLCDYAVVASRAFNHDGRVFVWVAFVVQSNVREGITAQVQNTYFLYRDDGLLVAKAAQAVCGGFSGGDTSAAAVEGWLPNVQNTATNKYSFCGTERRRVPIGEDGGSNFADRGPRDVEVEFDCDEARRVARLGRTLYIAGGQVCQYDGEGVTEVGFHVVPYYLNMTALGSGGSLSAGEYTYQASLRWDNAKGETDRSGSLAWDTITAVSNDSGRMTNAGAVNFTRKGVNKPDSDGGLAGRAQAAFELWRTTVNPTDPVLFYLATGSNPATTSGANSYVYNQIIQPTVSNTTFDDDMADVTLATKETFYENQNVLVNVAPPAASIIAASDTRLFLAGIAYNPLLVWYSKQRGEDEVAAFSDELTFSVPSTGGDITALAFLNNTLVVFKETAIYAMPGEGFDNVGGGQNYGAPQLISTNLGASSADLVTATDNGLFFFSNKGWYLLDRSFSLRYVGEKVEDYNSDAWNSVTLIENKRQIRCASPSRVLLFDYGAGPEGSWSEWEETLTRSSCYWNVTDTGTQSGHWLLTSETPSKVRREAVAFTQANLYSLTWKSAPISINDLSLGSMRVLGIGVLGEYRTAHSLKIELFRNHESTAFQTKLWTVSPTTAGGPEIVVHRPSVQRMATLQIQITARAVGELTTYPTSEAFKLSGITLELGQRGGLHRLPAAQKT